MPAAGPSGGGPGTAKGVRKVGRAQRIVAGRRAPAPQVARVPGISAAATAVARHARPLSKSRVTPHLAQHRADVARRTAQVAHPAQGARPLSAARVTPHLVEHRRNRAAQQAAIRSTGIPRLASPSTRRAEGTARALGGQARQALEAVKPLIVGQNRVIGTGRAKVNRDLAANVEQVTGPFNPLGLVQSVTSPSVSGRDLQANLEGRGGLQRVSAAAAKSVADFITRNFGTSGLQRFEPTKPTNVATAGPDPGTQFTVNALKDVVDLPAQIVPSVYLPLKKAAEGDIGGAVGQFTKPYADLVKDLQKFTFEHPVVTYLMLSGAKAAVGKGTGAVGRGVARATGNQALGRAVARDVIPTEVAGTNLRATRVGTDDLITKAAQALNRRYGTGALGRTIRGEGLRRAQAKGDLAKVDALRHKGAKRAPERMTEGQIRKAMDLYVYGRESIRRANRDVTLHETRQAVKTAGKGGAKALVTTAQQITHADPADIAHYIVELERALEDHPDAPVDVRRANVAVRDQLRQALDQGVDREKLALAVDQLHDVLSPRERKLIETDILDAKRAEKSKLIPPAVRRLGSERGTVRDGASVEQGVARKAREKAIGDIKDRMAAGDVTGAALSTRELQHIDDRLAALQDEVGHDYTGQVVREGENATPLTLADMRAQLAPHLEREPLFVSHRPGRKASSSMFVGWYPGPRGIEGNVRTGEATRMGAFDAHPDVLSQQAARMQGLIDANDTYAGWVDMVGLRQHGGPGQRPLLSFDSKAEAMREADRRNTTIDESGRPRGAAGAHRWVAVRQSPLSHQHDLVDEMLSRTDVGNLADDTTRFKDSSGQDTSIRETLADAAEGKDGPGKWALVPAEAAEQVADHFRILGDRGAMQGFRMVNSAFRKAVLATNPRWLYGNVGEGLLRMAAQHGFNPVSIIHSAVFMRRVVKEMRDPVEARQLEAAGHQAAADILRRKGRLAADELANYAWGGGIYQSASFTGGRHAPIDRFPEGTKMRSLAEMAQAAHGAPVIGLFPKAWDFWTTTVFSKVNGRLESEIQKVMAGKATRDLVTAQRNAQRFSGAGRLMGTAVEQAARGLTGTSEQIQLGRVVMRAYGQYHGWSPNARKLIEDYTPFVAWTWNAFRFVTSVLPKDHPVQTGLLAAAYQSSQDWRRQHGLSWFGAKGQLPAFLQGTVPTTGGSHVNPGRYTPFSFAANPLETLAGNVLPQFSGPLLALKGLDWTGKQLKGSYWSRVGKAAEEFATATVPAAPQIAQIISKGQSPGEGALALLDPLPEYKKKKGGGKSSGGGRAASPGGYNFGLSTGGSQAPNVPAGGGSAGGYNYGP